MDQQLPNPLTYKYNHVRVPVVDEPPYLDRPLTPAMDLRYIEYTRRWVYSEVFGEGAVWTTGGNITHGPAYFKNGMVRYISLKGEPWEDRSSERS